MEAKKDHEIKMVQALDLLQEAKDCDTQASFIALHQNNKRTAQSLIIRATTLRNQAKQLVIYYNLFFMVYLRVAH